MDGHSNVTANDAGVTAPLVEPAAVPALVHVGHGTKPKLSVRCVVLVPPRAAPPVGMRPATPSPPRLPQSHARPPPALGRANTGPSMTVATTHDQHGYSFLALPPQLVDVLEPSSSVATTTGVPTMFDEMTQCIKTSPFFH
ncbi:hypothetical protein ACQJBY_041333 [Aegilops geniculata]